METACVYMCVPGGRHEAGRGEMRVTIYHLIVLVVVAVVVAVVMVVVVVVLLLPF